MSAGVVVRLERADSPDLADLLTPPPSWARVLVARDGATHRVIGVVALAPGPDDFAELLGLAVVADARRGGVARRLVAAAESYARVQRIRTLRFRVPADAEDALATARALCFTEVDGFGAHVGDPAGVCFARAV